MFNNVNEAIEWVINRRKTDFSHSFEDFRTFMTTHGNPQEGLKIIHVAGTNGKGSTTNYLRNILQCAGYCVGSFTSPHLLSHLDRIRINDENIDEGFFLESVNRYRDEFEQQRLSMFEIDTFIAFKYFAEKKVDFAVIEVGLGGRLDSTNVVKPLISVITNIEMDHMTILGNTIAEIAFEKAGIIKDDTPVVTFESKKEALDVFEKQCLLHHCELIHTAQAKNIRQCPNVEFDYRHLHVSVPTMALYQAYNSSLAVETIFRLNAMGITRIDDATILLGLNTVWKGRFEVLGENPMVIVDGAHNDNGVDELCRTLKKLGGEYVIVFSALKDKTFHDMLLKLMNCGEVIVTQFENYRCTSAKELSAGTNTTVIEDYRKAIETAKTKGKTVVITGSLYFVSIVEEYLCYNKGR